MNTLILHRTGPGTTVQDLGRPGYLSQGLSRGGAADPVALVQGAALLNQPPSLAALEFQTAIEIEVTEPCWIALTGAPRSARRDETPLAWNACYPLKPGEKLSLGAADGGNFSYLHLSGGIDTPLSVGGRGAHLAAGLGAPLGAGQRLPLGEDPSPEHRALRLDAEATFHGGTVRVLAGPQTPLFSEDALSRFFSAPMTRTAWGNRQGVKLGFEGDSFSPEEGLAIVSEIVVPGDIQVTGDGTPFVLGPECQTVGGYPRIGTVLPQDLPIVMQATPGAKLRFELVSLDEALSDYRSIETIYNDELGRVTAQDLNPYSKLWTHNLISGVITGKFEDEDIQ